MLATDLITHHEAGGIVECDIVAAATAAFTAAELPRLREPILATFSDRLGNALLKQADEQSLPALSAFREIFLHQPDHRAAATHWGLVAAPRMPGRKRVTDALPKFKEAGAWSVSPHIIPHCTLHSLSGLLSQGLGLLGPNIGAGGMRGGEGEALTIAAAWLATEHLPGVWVVLTGWDVEPASSVDGHCQAVVLGLRFAKAAATTRPRLCIAPATGHSPSDPSLTLEELRTALDTSAEGCWHLPGAGTLTLQPAIHSMEAAA